MMKTPKLLTIFRRRTRIQSPSNRTSQGNQKTRSAFGFFRLFTALLFRKKEVNSITDRPQSDKRQDRISHSTDNSTGSSNKSSSRSRYSHSRESSSTSSIIQVGSLHTTFVEIRKATGNFSSANKIGEGAFGTVYRGTLKDGSMVAIKRMKKETYDQRLAAEFKNEVLTLSSIEHMNLVRFYGYLEHEKELIIIVEYVSNGTLREHLDGLRQGELEIAERLDIATDVAHAITYLHTYSEPPIIHRDIKASNILITDKFRAKVADFGFARLTDDKDPEATHISTQVKGTAGYLDPEYLKTFQLTEKSDVYSFGVLLVEMMTGRHPIDESRSINERVTARWAMRKLKDGEIVVSMDRRLRRNPASVEAVEKVLKLARQCLSTSRYSRPSMRKCAEVLWEIRKEFKDRSTVQTASTSHLSANVIEGSGKTDRQDLYGITDSDYYRFYSA